MTTLQRLDRARAAFDTITGAAYHGMAFRGILVDDLEALTAAEKLAECLQRRAEEVGLTSGKALARY